MKAGWEVKPLGELAEIYQPKTISKKEMDPAGEYPVFGANGIIGRYNQYNHEQSEILLGCRGACGCVNVSEPRSWITGNSMVVRPRDEQLQREFLRYYLDGAIDLEGVITGTAQPQITRKSLAPVSTPLPPLAEQKRIVAVLDEAFEGLDRARANAEANLADAREVFEGFLSELFSDPPDSWERCTLDEMCRKITVGHVGPMKDRYVPEGIIFLRSQNVRPFEIDLHEVKFIDKRFADELEKSVLRPGDVAIVRTGYPGTCAVIPDNIELANCADLVIARPNDELRSDFLALLLNSSFGKKLVAGASVGAAQKHFNVGAAKSAIFPFPAPEMQDQLVERANLLRNQSIEIAKQTTAKLADIADLRQSLLQKAFAGELT